MAALVALLTPAGFQRTTTNAAMRPTSLRIALTLCAASHALKLSPSREFLKAPAASQGLNRRELLIAPAALALAPYAARAADTKTISVPVGSSAKDGSPLSKATFSVPADWVKLSGDPGGGRKMELYADPNNADTNAFALITPVRGDYTSLGSFGSVEVVQDTVMPAAPDITYDVIKSEAQTGKYVYEYIVQVPEQPKRHLTTIFMVVSDCIVTFNFQAKQSDYNGDVPGLAKTVAASFKTGKAS